MIETETTKYKASKPRYTIEAVSDKAYYTLLDRGVTPVNLNRTKVCGFFSIEEVPGGFDVVGNGPAEGIRRHVPHTKFGPVAYYLPALVNDKLSIITVAGNILPDRPLAIITEALQTHLENTTKQTDDFAALVQQIKNL
jgi:hypothetical protein